MRFMRKPKTALVAALALALGGCSFLEDRVLDFVDVWGIKFVAGKGMKVGIPKEYRVEGMPQEIEALWQKGIAWLKDAGAEIVDISLPHTKYALPAYYIVAPAEASSNLARYDGVRYGLRVPGKDIVDMYEKTRAAGFGNEMHGTGIIDLRTGHGAPADPLVRNVRDDLRFPFRVSIAGPGDAPALMAIVDDRDIFNVVHKPRQIFEVSPKLITVGGGL